MEIFEYRGYDMRSHSETRWAAMMDFVGIRWLYEHRTYRTRHGGYLPDFYLPDVQCFFEVKGPEPTEEEQAKALDVEAATGMPVIFGYGSPKLDGIYLGSGFLKRGKVQVSLYELSAGMAKMFGEEYALRFALAGRLQSAPQCVAMSELMKSYLLSKMGRSVVEKGRFAEHQPINAGKLLAHYVPTYPAALVGACVERMKQWKRI